MGGWVEWLEKLKIKLSQLSTKLKLKLKLSLAIFCNFQALMISQVAIKRCFKNIVIQINLVNNSPVTNTRINERGGAREKDDKGVAKHGDYINGDMAVNSIKFSNKVEGDAKENNPRDQVNIMTNDDEYREKFRILVDEMDQKKHLVQSLCSPI